MNPLSIHPGALPEPSFDGYFRLTFEAFSRLVFVRRFAWEDTELGHELRTENIPAHRAGYCEWDTGGTRAVSIGWTWFVIADGSMFISPGGVNSNLVLVDRKHYDLGASRTGELLRAWLSGVAWRPENPVQL
jgi:hypothetical protein